MAGGPRLAETGGLGAAQNAVTEAYLAALPVARGSQTPCAPWSDDRERAFRSVGGHYVVTRNDGRQAQDVWYVADSLASSSTAAGC